LASQASRAASLPVDAIRRAGGAAHVNIARLRCACLTGGARIWAHRSSTGLSKGAAAIPAPACRDAKIGASTKIGSAASRRAIPAFHCAIRSRIEFASVDDCGSAIFDGGDPRVAAAPQLWRDCAARALTAKAARHADDKAAASVSGERCGLGLKPRCCRRVGGRIAAQALVLAEFAGYHEVAIRVASTREVGRDKLEIDAPGAAVGRADPDARIDRGPDAESVATPESSPGCAPLSLSVFPPHAEASPAMRRDATRRARLARRAMMWTAEQDQGRDRSKEKWSGSFGWIPRMAQSVWLTRDASVAMDGHLPAFRGCCRRQGRPTAMR
jgi:hypothetical protein